MISGFLIVRMLSPDQFGLYSGVGIYLGYILLGNFGIINGLGRELPYELGRGKNEYAKELASSVFVLVIFLSLLAMIFFLSFSIFCFVNNENILGLIFLSYAVVSAFYLLNKQFLPTLYRTNNDFNSLSRQNIILGFVNLITVALVFFFQIYGLILRGIVLAIYEFYLLYKNKPYKLYCKINFSHYKYLIKTGFPIYMVGQVNPLWVTILNSLLFSMGGANYFGLYSLSNIVQGAIGIIPASFSGVIYPKMAIMFGEGKSITQILYVNKKPLIFQFVFILLIAIICALLLPFVIPKILPKYVDGISAAQWMCFVPVVLSFSALNNLYNILKKQKWYFISLIFGAVIGSLFVWISIKNNGFNLNIFPKGLILGSVIQQSLSYVFLHYIIKKHEHSYST